MAIQKVSTMFLVALPTKRRFISTFVLSGQFTEICDRADRVVGVGNPFPGSFRKSDAGKSDAAPPRRRLACLPPGS